MGTENRDESGQAAYVGKQGPCLRRWPLLICKSVYKFANVCLGGKEGKVTLDVFVHLCEYAYVCEFIRACPEYLDICACGYVCVCVFYVSL